MKWYLKIFCFLLAFVMFWFWLWATLIWFLLQSFTAAFVAGFSASGCVAMFVTGLLAWIAEYELAKDIKQ